MKNLLKRTEGKYSFIKFDLKMKLSALFLLTSMFVLQANDSYSQRTKVTVNLEQVTVEEVIETIESKTEYRFLYLLEDVDLGRIVSIKVNKKKVDFILDKIFKNTKTNYQVDGKQISLTRFANSKILKSKVSENKKQSVISGIVTDEKGEPLPGASVYIKGTSVGTTTDLDGKFTIEAPDGNQTLVVSYTGFTPVEIEINESTNNLSVSLKVDAQALDEVVITGYQLSNQKAINTKRASIAAIDVLSADEAGKLPDFNAGDALRRVPGVNVIQDQAEARFISLRGLNATYNATTVDGFRMATPDRDGRRVFTDLLPSSLASRIEVAKTVTSDMDGHAIGGQINFKSRSAFDYSDQLFLVTASLGQYSLNEGYRGSSPSGNAEIAWANKFGENDKFGFAIDASYYKRDSYIPQLETGSQWYWFNDAGDRVEPYGGNGIAVPRERRWYLYHNDRQRYGFNGKFDFRPSEKLNWSVGSYFYQATDSEARMENTSTAGGASGTLSNQTPTSGTFDTGVNTAVQLGRFEFERNVYGINSILNLGLGENSSLDIATGYSKSTFDNPEEWDRFGRSDLGFDYDTSGEFMTFTPTDNTAYQDLSAYTLARHRLDERQLNEDVFEAQIDLGVNNDPDYKGWGFESGLKFRTINRDYNEERTNWTGDAYNLADVAGTDDFSTGQQGGRPGQFLLIDENLAKQAFRDTRSLLTEAIDENQSNRLDYDANENVFALYGQGVYKNDKTSLIFGLRYEHTNFSSNGRVNDGTGFGPTSNSSDYGVLLPAINFAYNTSDDTKLRFAYSRTLGRAPFAVIAARGESISDTGAEIVVSRGNPDLNPRISDNFDALFDWYIKGGGLISGGVFYKSIKDEFFRFSDLETIDIQGVTTEARVTQARNSEDNTSVFGVELNFIKHFTSLPGFWGGFGVSANATFLTTDFQVTLSDGEKIDFNRLAEQPNSIYNATIFYEKYGAKVRLAYNHTGEMWNSRFSNFSSLENVYRNRFQQARDVFDLQLAYDLTKNVTLSANIWNLTGEGTQENIGRDQEIQQMNNDFGSAWFLGATFKL